MTKIHHGLRIFFAKTGNAFLPFGIIAHFNCICSLVGIPAMPYCFYELTKTYFVPAVKGQERAVIILTTTRSSTSFLDPDTKQVLPSFVVHGNIRA
jgi:hypothetical protein